MTTQPIDEVPAYRVTGISPGQYSVDAAGNTVEGYVVHFELRDGTPGEAFVPKSRWTPGNAEAEILAQVQTLSHVRNLSSGM